MTGKIIKGIAGFYYVHDGVSKVYECKAKGVFRNRKIKPLVGDNVEFDVLSEEQSLGNIVEILPRENSLIRPAVANIDQAMIVFAVADPEPNLNLLDRFLVTMAKREHSLLKGARHHEHRNRIRLSQRPYGQHRVYHRV